MIVLASLLFAILLFQFYSSFIVGSLLIDPPKTIRTVQQLLDSHLVCGLDKVSYISDIFNHVTDKVAIELYHKKVLAKNNLFPLNNGLEKIKQGGFAFFTDVSSSYIRLMSLYTGH